MTPLEFGGLDSVLASQLNNQNMQNTQMSQPSPATQPQGNQNTPDTQNLQNEKSTDYINTNKDNLEKQIQKAIEQLTQSLSYLNTHLNITLDKKADSLVIKIIDNKTNQVIKEIPPEYMLRIAEAINNLVGIIVNKKV
ncbi:MAG: flagellar biosynthesis protein FlaG [Hydrogenobaculum sp.]|nr:MAG: flagellar biosynthesis protein FlaG [Hydrogenobaculum sp.]PMP91847.1 MAG: flagellar biosynthesis protein FlaG [Hydrogenobaculum sp.]